MGTKEKEGQSRQLIGPWGKFNVYFSRGWGILIDEPREANVLPAMFETAAMTRLMVLVVGPFGVFSALCLREYPKQGKLASTVRFSVNNLADQWVLELRVKPPLKACVALPRVARAARSMLTDSLLFSQGRPGLGQAGHRER